MSQKFRKKLIAAIAINALMVVLEIVCFFLSIKEYVAMGGFFLMFEFYTVDSNMLNLIAAAIFTLFGIRLLKGKVDRIPKWVRMLRYMAAAGVTLTLIVVLTILGPSTPGGMWTALFSGSFFGYHFLCPLLSFVSFAFLEGVPQSDGYRIGRKESLIAFIPTFLYGGIAIILNIMDVIVGPYVFLMVMYFPVIISVINIGIVAIGAYIIIIILRVLNRKLASRGL